jgi:hypothetical protein
MLGADDVFLIFVATTVANLVVEVGAEVVAEWLVNSPESPVRPPDVDPSAVGLSPDPFTEISVKVDQAAHLPTQMMTLVNGHMDSTVLWSGQMIQTLGSGLGLQ